MYYSGRYKDVYSKMVIRCCRRDIVSIVLSPAIAYGVLHIHDCTKSIFSVFHYEEYRSLC